MLVWHPSDPTWVVAVPKPDWDVLQAQLQRQRDKRVRRAAQEKRATKVAAQAQPDLFGSD